MTFDRGVPRRPLISVLIPVYNAEHFLAAAIDSILAQTLDDFEVVIVDDGSTDRSGAILEEYARADRRVRLLRRANAGHTAALIAGLDECTGDFVARMDADDIAFPERFERQIAHLRSHPDVLAVGTAALLIDEFDAVIGEASFPAAHEEIDRDLMGCIQAGILHPSAMIRRDALLKVGSYRSEFVMAEDRDLWLRLAELGRLANLPDVLMRYRVHASNVSYLKHTGSLRAMRECLEQAHRRRGLPCPSDLMADAPRAMNAWERRQSMAWSAVQTGQLKSARKHVWRLFRERPFARATWVLLAYCVFGMRTDALRRLYRRLRGTSGSQADSEAS